MASWLARILLLISAILAGATAKAAESKAGDFQLMPHLECGLYRVEGLLRAAGDDGYRLVQRNGSSSPLEYILLGGDLDAVETHAGRPVNVEVYVPRPIRDNNKPFLFLRKFLELRSIAEEKTEKIGNEACGHKK